MVRRIYSQKTVKDENKVDTASDRHLSQEGDNKNSGYEHSQLKGQHI